MPPVYGFNEDGFRRVKEATRRILGTPSTGTQRRRQPPVLSGGGGTAQLIRFRIVTADNCGTCTATAEVISVMGGGTVTGEDSYGIVTIYDRSGCHLNDVVELLEGRIGYAAYMVAREDGPCPGLPSSGWEIISLCDTDEVC